MAASPDRSPAAAPWHGPRHGACRRPSRWPGRLALLLAALLGIPAAAEIGLRVVFGADVRRALESRRRVIASDAQTVLCVGDSYTFGLYYRPEESYPGRLEQILRAGASERGDGRAAWFVENGGIPAQNTAQMAARLDSQLASLRPRAVVVLAGFNDRWNFAESVTTGAAGAGLNGGGGGSTAFESLVLVRLIRLVLADRPTTARADGLAQADPTASRLSEFREDRIALPGAAGEGGVAIDIRKTGQRLDDESHQRLVETRLAELVARIRAAHALPLLCSYPSPEPNFEPPSRAAAAVAATAGVPFVDLRALFARELERRRYEELLIPGDRHPTDRGYWRMAVAIAAELKKSGLFEPMSPLAEELDGAEARGFACSSLPEQLHPVRLAPGASRGEFMLSGPPGAKWRVLVSDSETPAQRFGALELRLAEGPRFAASVEHERCRGVLNADGRAAWTLPPELDAAKFVALAVLHDPLVGAPEISVRAVAGPLPLPPR
jgi:lysophospholipase L1-like esterase